MSDRKFLERIPDDQIEDAIERLKEQGYYEETEEGELRPTEEGKEWLREQVGHDDERVLEAFQQRIGEKVEDQGLGNAIRDAAKSVRDELGRNAIATLEENDWTFPDGTQLNLKMMLGSNYPKVKKVFDPEDT